MRWPCLSVTVPKFQEVVPVDTDLQLLRLRDLEILEEPNVPVEERASIDSRQLSPAVLPDLRREAVSSGEVATLTQEA